MSEQEQNKRINQLRRQLSNAVERIKTLELDADHLYIALSLLISSS